MSWFGIQQENREEFMKIGIDAHMLGDFSGGNESYYTNIINHLDPPNNVEIILFVNQINSLKSIKQNFKCVEFKSKSSLVRNFIELPYLCKKYKLDLLHTQYFVPFIRPCKVVCTIHDICFEHYKNIFTKKDYLIQKTLIPYAARKSQTIFTVSNHAKQDIISHYGVSEENIVVTYNAVNEKFKELNEKELGASELREKFNITGNRVLLTVGNLQPRKNLPRLIRAFIELKKDNNYEDVQLVIVGKKAWMYNDILIEASKNSDDIVLTDYVSEEDLVRLYNLADAFVYPSYFEGFGIPPLEALACNTNVAVSNVSSLPEVVGDVGEYFNPFDEKDIEKCLKKILSREYKNYLDYENVERAKLFSWSNSAEKIMKIYQKIGKESQ